MPVHTHAHTMPLALSALALISTARALLHSKIVNVNLTFESVKFNTLPVFISFHICQSYLNVFELLMLKKKQTNTMCLRDIYAYEWKDNYPLDSGHPEVIVIKINTNGGKYAVL